MTWLGYADPMVTAPSAAFFPVEGLGGVAELNAWKALNWSKQTALNNEARRAGQPLPFPRIAASWDKMQTDNPPAGLTVAAMKAAALTWQKRAAAANAPKPVARPAVAAAVRRVPGTAIVPRPQVVTVRGAAPAPAGEIYLGYRDPAVVGGLQGMPEDGLGSFFSKFIDRNKNSIGQVSTAVAAIAPAFGPWGLAVSAAAAGVAAAVPKAKQDGGFSLPGVLGPAQLPSASGYGTVPGYFGNVAGPGGPSFLQTGSGLPSWALPAGLGLAALLLLKGRR